MSVQLAEEGLAGKPTVTALTEQSVILSGDFQFLSGLAGRKSHHSIPHARG